MSINTCFRYYDLLIFFKYSPTCFSTIACTFSQSILLGKSGSFGSFGSAGSGTFVGLVGLGVGAGGLGMLCFLIVFILLCANTIPGSLFLIARSLLSSFVDVY